MASLNNNIDFVSQFLTWPSVLVLISVVFQQIKSSHHENEHELAFLYGMPLRLNKVWPLGSLAL